MGIYVGCVWVYIVCRLYTLRGVCYIPGMGLVLRTFKVDEDAWEAFLVRCREERTSASAALRAFVGDETVVRRRGGARVRVEEPAVAASAPAPKAPRARPEVVAAPVVPERPFVGPYTKEKQVGKRR